MNVSTPQLVLRIQKILNDELRDVVHRMKRQVKTANENIVTR